MVFANPRGSNPSDLLTMIFANAGKHASSSGGGSVMAAVAQIMFDRCCGMKSVYLSSAISASTGSTLCKAGTFSQGSGGPNYIKNLLSVEAICSIDRPFYE